MIGELAPHPNPFVQPGTYDWTSSDTAMTDGIPHAMLKAQREYTHPLASPDKVRSHLRQHHGVNPGHDVVEQHAQAHISQLMDQGHNYDTGEITHDADPGTSSFANAPKRTVDLVRHVRTAAGEKLFKKPIGSVITEGEYAADKAAERKVSGSESAPNHADLLRARAEARAKYPQGHPERLKAERAVRQSRKSEGYRSAKGTTEETSTPKAEQAARSDKGFYAPGEGHGPVPNTKEEIISHLVQHHNVSESMLRRGGGESGSSRSLRSLQSTWNSFHGNHPDDEQHDNLQPKRPQPHDQVSSLTPDQQRVYWSQRNGGLNHERAYQNASRTPTSRPSEQRKRDYQRLVKHNSAQNHYLGNQSLARAEFENLPPGSREVIGEHLANAHAAEQSGDHESSARHLASAIDVAEQTNTRRTRQMRENLESRLHHANTKSAAHQSEKLLADVNSLPAGSRSKYHAFRQLGDDHATAMHKARGTVPPGAGIGSGTSRVRRLLNAEFRPGEGEMLTGQKALTPSQRAAYKKAREQGQSHGSALAIARRVS